MKTQFEAILSCLLGKNKYETLVLESVSVVGSYWYEKGTELQGIFYE